ncbi:septum formation inhibitor Maf [Sabulilitoribacter arenilitoris]|uniref:Septum formation inhibitor Maf n=1 Tax=Wocania arenilitoris TaxID=2044858 RepID=A0AAE3JMV7_9FLAO|nr:septum formation inhibitor Maf [Wocania arenilitoris]MCF7568116.1 septum formation inhibitor Maf [Wocania arenilitoris]
MRTLIKLSLVIVLLICLASCKNESKQQKDMAVNFATETAPTKKLSLKEPPQAFKDYWYAGKAEITSYKLEQARYGEIRNGKAVLIYVTEDFLPNKQVKADNQNPNNISVLKLNATKKFNTGLYPYSVMQSTFYPVSNNQHAIKVTSSMQEWCGHVYAQLNNRDKFEVSAFSYFESEGDQNFKLEKAILENELWTQLRINPKSLPTGNIKIIPSLEYSRLKHVKLKAYNAKATLSNDTFSIDYPGLNRTLAIKFNPNFPYDIESWEETFKSGFGKNAKTLTTKATKLKTIKSAYWGKNSNGDEVLRDTLQLN